MVELQENLARLEQSGLALAAVSYDSPETLREFATEHGITFRLLSDPGSATIDAYGVRNREASGRFDGIPLPGFFLIAPDGKVSAKLFNEGYKERHGSAALIEAAAALE